MTGPKKECCSDCYYGEVNTEPVNYGDVQIIEAVCRYDRECGVYDADTMWCRDFTLRNPCPKCDGKGDAYEWGEGTRKLMFKTCSHCKGTGKDGSASK
jgi:hypothetical protein